MNRKERGLNDIIANRNAFKDWRDPKQSEQICLCKKMLPETFALPTFVHDLLQTWSIIHEYIAWPWTCRYSLVVEGAPEVNVAAAKYAWFECGLVVIMLLLL